ncbi:MAG: hypothetical protein QXG39_02555 [Candidatus Aenigmatarchaeota archaeon]
MGLGSNILIFMIILNIVLIVMGLSDSTLITMFLTINRETNQVAVNTSFIAILVAVISTASIIALSLGFMPNISLGSLMMLLISFATFPIGVFNSSSLPFEFKLMFGGVISIMYLIALISFARGSEF